MLVGIQNEELDTCEPFLEHSGDGVRAAAADADHLDARAELRLLFDQDISNLPSLFLTFFFASELSIAYRSTSPAIPGEARFHSRFSLSRPEYMARPAATVQAGLSSSGGQPSMPIGKTVPRLAVQHSLGHVTHSGKHGASAGQNGALQK